MRNGKSGSVGAQVTPQSEAERPPYCQAGGRFGGIERRSSSAAPLPSLGSAVAEHHDFEHIVGATEEKRDENPFDDSPVQTRVKLAVTRRQNTPHSPPAECVR